MAIVNGSINVPDSISAVDYFGMPDGSGGTSGGSSQLSSALAKLEQAINMGSQRQYDIALAELMGVFQGNPTLKAQEDTGMVNGKPTVDALKLDETQRANNLQTMTNVLGDAARLTGPENYGAYETYTGAGRNLLQQVMAGRPYFAAPQGDMEPLDLSSLLNRLGLGMGQSPKPSSSAISGVGTNAGGGGAISMRKGQDGKYSLDLGGGGLSTNPNDAGTTDTTDYSQYPMIPNPGDIAYAQSLARSGGTYNANDYQGFTGRGGYSPDWTPIVTVPGNPGVPQTKFQTAWGEYDPNAPYGPRQNPSITRLVYNQLVRGSTQGTNHDTDSMSDPEIGAAVADWVSKQRVGATSDTTTGTGEPGWFGNYMAQLIGLGPDVNRGAAENLEMLHQLGLANPQGLAILKNPAGNVTPAYWDSLGKTGQQLLTQAAGKVFGWNPDDFQAQIDATRPLGVTGAVGSTQTQYAPMALAA